uniref:Secreted protein n=1 Tax=Panagrellus redivivus TaxID=6233 RepID=A0A7E4UNH8_PANRE
MAKLAALVVLIGMAAVVEMVPLLPKGFPRRVNDGNAANSGFADVTDAPKPATGDPFVGPLPLPDPNNGNVVQPMAPGPRPNRPVTNNGNNGQYSKNGGGNVIGWQLNGQQWVMRDPWTGQVVRQPGYNQGIWTGQNGPQPIYPGQGVYTNGQVNPNQGNWVQNNGNQPQGVWPGQNVPQPVNPGTPNLLQPTPNQAGWNNGLNVPTDARSYYYHYWYYYWANLFKKEYDQLVGNQTTASTQSSSIRTIYPTTTKVPTVSTATTPVESTTTTASVTTTVPTTVTTTTVAPSTAPTTVASTARTLPVPSELD